MTGGSRRAQAVTACTAAPLLLWALLITWPARMPVPDHAVSGIVTAVAPTRLAIRRARRTPPDMTFAVDASTVREGVIAVGAQVQVRFRDGHPPVATAILAVRRI